VVAVADVYDALVSNRVYINAYANEVAFNMIMDGECGQFSPDVLECLELAKEDFFNITKAIKDSSFA
ncbi:MAG: two-component system response regulator, partial [Kineothrix sp.]|nr:two-component system response regulator [Kineothrix sp.]